MKAVRLALAGRERYLAFTVEAMFQLEERFGGTRELIDTMSANTRDGFAAACKAAAILADGAPTAARGTAPAMDHGTRGARVMAEFSRSMANVCGSGSLSWQSWWVSITASVWLQATMEVIALTASVAPKEVIRRLSASIFFFRGCKRPVPSKIPA